MLSFSQFDSRLNQEYISVFMGFPHREPDMQAEQFLYKITDPTGKALGSSIHNLMGAWKTAKNVPGQKRIRVEPSTGLISQQARRNIQHASSIGKILEPHYDFHGSENHKSIIQHYTANGYFDINDHLRHGGAIEDHKDAHDLSRALTKYRSPMKLHLFTGIKEDPRKIMTPEHELQGHMPLHLPAFTSTSLNPDTARGFAEHDEVPYHHDPMPKYKRKPNLPFNREKHVVVIHAPKGIHGAYIEPYSDSKGEHEFILHAGAKLHLHTKPQTQRDGTNYWHAKLVHSGIEELKHY
jgi:hypothetical protein